MLIRKGLDIVIEHELRDSNGRMLLLKMLINEKKYFLVNVYGPNKDAEAIKFFQYLSTTLRAMDFESNDNVIIGGDFNCPLDPAKDKKGGILIPRQHLINLCDVLENARAVTNFQLCRSLFVHQRIHRFVKAESSAYTNSSTKPTVHRNS